MASSDRRLDDLPHTSSAPRPTATATQQLDLFRNSPVTRATNTLLDAIRAGDAGEARGARIRLVELVPDHAHAAPGTALIEMLETPTPGDAGQGFEWTRRLEEEWAPAASALFGAVGGTELLAPFWRAAGRAIESGGRLDSWRPDRHPSAAYLHGRDWQNVKRSVLATPDHEGSPGLLTRLAEAEYRMGHRRRAVSHWFMLCWRAPEAFRTLIDGPDFPDPATRDAWSLAGDQDDPGFEMSPEWFPAWMLLHEYGLARALAPQTGERDGRTERGGKNDPERAFGLLATLLTRPANDAENLAIRRALRSIHPGLFRHYMAMLDSRTASRPASSP